MKKPFNYTEAYRKYGNEKYLAPGETFEQVVARDAETLKHHGVTREEIGSSLRRLFSTYNDFLGHRAPGPQEPVAGMRLGRHYWELGSEGCPYLSGVASSIDWIVGVEGLPNGNKAHHPEDGPTFVSDMLPAMIEQLGFFEGNVYYGIKPEWAVAVHNMVKDADLPPYVPKYEKRAWTGVKMFFQSWEGEKDKTLLDTPKELIRKATHKEIIIPGVTGYVAPGHLNIKLDPWSKGVYSDHPEYKRRMEFWGVLVADEKAILPPDALLMGMPFDKYTGSLDKGDIEVINMFLSFDKQVG
ncbi:MAG: hypothetical protein HY367_00180 [Candidatus Aenigmarchaeota archaeon]|nr:hypothetical protein [Candidatus Aenigmarchaeota archaeon]